MRVCVCEEKGGGGGGGGDAPKKGSRFVCPFLHLFVICSSGSAARSNSGETRKRYLHVTTFVQIVIHFDPHLG